MLPDLLRISRGEVIWIWDDAELPKEFWLTREGLADDGGVVEVIDFFGSKIK